MLITGEKLQLLRLSGSSTYVLVSVLVLSLCVEAFANTEDFKTVNAHVRIHDIPVFIYYKFLLRTQDLKTKKHHIPVVDRTPLEPPPVVVVVVGPPKVGKSTVIKCLIKNFTRQKLVEIRGPVTIVSGENKDRRNGNA